MACSQPLVGHEDAKEGLLPTMQQPSFKTPFVRRHGNVHLQEVCHLDDPHFHCGHLRGRHLRGTACGSHLRDAHNGHDGQRDGQLVEAGAEAAGG